MGLVSRWSRGRRSTLSRGPRLRHGGPSEHTTVCYNCDLPGRDLGVYAAGSVASLASRHGDRRCDCDGYATAHGKRDGNQGARSYVDAKAVGASLIQWVPIDLGVPTTVVMPEHRLVEGVAEPASNQLRKGSVVQFERFGFVRIDDVTTRIVAYYAHK